MTYHPDDTIAAIGTAPGGAARGMVRMSGAGVAQIVERVFAADNGAELASVSSRAAVVAGQMAIVLDGRSLQIPCNLFYWPTRRSYTCEPVAEFHTLGSPPLVRAVLEAVCHAGARLAEPGEFTLRAFLAGRLDLTQAEAVLGVIDAHDASDLDAAVEQLAGNLARPLHHLREELLMLLAELEAGLDFVEEDIEFISAATLGNRLQVAIAELDAVADQLASRQTANDACQIVLLGATNAGKSSLFNALAERFGTAEHALTPAIVSDVRGTTRDYLAAHVELDGRRCELIDTAGLDAEVAELSEVDWAAQNRSAERRERSLLKVLCVDASDQNALERIEQPLADLADLVVFTKADLTEKRALLKHLMLPSILTSSVTGRGLTDLAAAIAKLLKMTTTAARANCVAATADRCRDSVRLASDAITHAAELASLRAGDELVAAEIRGALAELGKVVGAVYTDDLLDRIFKAFCIGK